ncbi:hypothetical protein CHARACLAT_010534 [Characodon lateralis]|uniref:Uncharacterized protein n=1 Tax=Characodon lateralis TaxID=208331 RepID=A0ABU7F2A7_9TELE|nr:hypothetical protein [Characodon lateralis]
MGVGSESVFWKPDRPITVLLKRCLGTSQLCSGGAGDLHASQWRNSLSDFCFFFEYICFLNRISVHMRNSEESRASEMSLPAGTKDLYRDQLPLASRNNK